MYAGAPLSFSRTGPWFQTGPGCPAQWLLGPGVPAPGPLPGTGSRFSRAFCGPGNPASFGAGGPSLWRPPRSQKTSLCTPHRLCLQVSRRDASRTDDDPSRARRPWTSSPTRSNSVQCTGSPKRPEQLASYARPTHCPKSGLEPEKGYGTATNLPEKSHSAILDYKKCKQRKQNW